MPAKEAAKAAPKAAPAKGAAPAKKERKKAEGPRAPRPKAIAVGLKKGHVVKKRTLPVRPVAKKAVLTKKRKLVKELIREVTGFAPYEKRIMELLRNSLDKRALKLAKKKLGTHVRGKRKREELSNVIAQQRARAAAQ
eukprot:TRINITY_DN14635_c0_g1_i1.p1 TRINITY_DN14635_c0_g1~~TRINITY_DN14635_c0_g1_i1.p1  ORF type:complete len:138 (+),score=56.09 TRINITY_DN14635_c0_g1_i1:107-520(+)